MRRKRPVPWWFWPLAFLGLVLTALGNYGWVVMMNRLAG